MNPPPAPLFQIRNLHTYYGRIQAVRGVSMAIQRGAIVTLIGSNGAGKTTILNTISGLLKPKEGEIIFEDDHLEHRPPHKIVRAGVSQVPEGRKIFSRLSVHENLQMGAFTRKDTHAVKHDLARVLTLFPRLRERRHQVAGTLSGGEQQMLAMGRALMARPKLLLLDEPSMGLAPVMVEAIFDTVVEINRQGCTILLVEQNAHLALQLASGGYVLQSGEIVLEGCSADLKDDKMIQAVYLGGELD